MIYFWLVVAGIGAGLCGSIAGLASLVSYPALLAAGLSPLAANVSNTVAMFATTTGSVWGARRELAGQRKRAVRLAAICAVGGIIGALLLLTLPAEAFEVVVPGLVALGGILLLARDRLRRWARARSAEQDASPHRKPSRWWLPVLLGVGMYGGYFGAGAGVIMLAVLSIQRDEPLPVTNAIKNIGTGAANSVAGIGYALWGPVHWAPALALGAGALIGGAVGPSVVRFLPERALRTAVGIAGILLAVHLAVS